MISHAAIDALPEPLRTVASTVASELQEHGVEADRACTLAAELAAAYSAERDWDARRSHSELLDHVDGTT